MTKTYWETKQSWIIFGEVLGYNKIMRKELGRIDPDFYESGARNDWLDYLKEDSQRIKFSDQLRTKSWRKMDYDDGIKISVMYDPPKNIIFDVYSRELAPTSGLLKVYRNGGINWNRLEKVFLEQIRQEAFLDKLIKVAKEEIVTLYCCEDRPDYCHRRLIAEEVKRRDELVKILVK